MIVDESEGRFDRRCFIQPRKIRVFGIAIQPHSLFAPDLKGKLFGRDEFVRIPFDSIVDDRAPAGIMAHLTNPDALWTELALAKTGTVFLLYSGAVEEVWQPLQRVILKIELRLNRKGVECGRHSYLAVFIIAIVVIAAIVVSWRRCVYTIAVYAVVVGRGRRV